MGCDIHLMVEFNDNSYLWNNGGSIDVERNYELFSILADVRNYNDIPSIDIKELKDCCCEFDNWLESWGSDAHSPNYATLKELRDYYNAHKNDTVISDRLILARNADGEIVATCAKGSTNADKLEPVGEVSLFGEFGDEYFTDLIKRLEEFKEFYKVSSDTDIRITYFFDN